MSEKPRILLIDALRGLAIAGILLLHHIEHFDLYLKPGYELGWLVKTDQWVWDNMFTLVSGKAFAMFSLLFGVSFWILNENRANRGEQYLLRHFWRMLLLALIGGIHLIFFRGDILIIYAFLGIFIIFSKWLNNKLLVVVSLILLLNPLYLYNFWAHTFDGQLYDFRLPYPKGNINKILTNGTFGEVLKMNFTIGYHTTLVWTWNVGRFFTILGLFYLGVYVAKTKLFISEGLKIWYSILVVSVILIYFLNWADMVWLKPISNKTALQLLSPMLDTYTKLSYMFLILSIIVILWRHNKGSLWIKRFTDFGRMGLTNYVLMSALGSMIYYGWGWGLYKYCGSLYTLMIGIFCLWVQMMFSSWWLKTHKQGPLEHLWRKLTWMKVQ